MPTIPTSRQAGGTNLVNKLDSTGYTWADTRNAATATGPNPISPTVMSPNAYKQSGGRGNFWGITRGTFGFDFSSVTGTITSLILSLYKSNSSQFMSNVIVVKNSNTWTNFPDSGDYNVDLSTPYSSGFSFPTQFGAGFQQQITLNSTAQTDAVGNGDFNLAVIDKDNDYDNVAPTGFSLYSAPFYYYDLTYYPRIAYIEQTGYGNTVTGVIPANIAEVTGVATANIEKVIDIS